MQFIFGKPAFLLDCQPENWWAAKPWTLSLPFLLPVSPADPSVWVRHTLPVSLISNSICSLPGLPLLPLLEVAPHTVLYCVTDYEVLCPDPAIDVQDDLLSLTVHYLVPVAYCHSSSFPATCSWTCPAYTWLFPRVIFGCSSSSMIKPAPCCTWLTLGLSRPPLHWSLL